MLFNTKTKRKRGYHRALKRREPWALLERSFKKMMDDFVCSLYSKNPFQTMVEKGDAWNGSPITVPLQYGHEDPDKK